MTQRVPLKIQITQQALKTSEITGMNESVKKIARVPTE